MDTGRGEASSSSSISVSQFIWMTVGSTIFHNEFCSVVGRMFGLSEPRPYAAPRPGERVSD